MNHTRPHPNAVQYILECVAALPQCKNRLALGPAESVSFRLNGKVHRSGRHL